MIFKKIGNEERRVIVLLHGGGLSWWSNQEIIERSKENYYVIAVVIDGHGENADETFISIEKSAEKLINFIDENCNGNTYALIGLSLGAQIIVETISQRSTITEYAIIESALVCPMRFIGKISPIMINSSYGLIKKKWFSMLQAKALFLPKSKWDLYFEESMKMTKESLVNIANSNAYYELKNSVSHTNAKALIITGEKEIKSMIKSGEKLKAKIPNSKLYIAKKMKHGELSLSYTQKYSEIIKLFLENEYTNIEIAK